MQIVVDRYLSNAKTTISRIHVDGRLLCYGCEDAYHETKIKGETRIPAGTYAVKVRYEGRHYERYVKQFAPWHRGTLQVMDVPNYQFIMIHIGNTEADTEGCLLLGSNVAVASGTLSVTGSTVAYERFYKRVIDAAEKNQLTITLVDNDRGHKNS